MGCAGALLAALPHDEAEAIATDLVERDALGFVGLSALPPKARTRAVERRRAALASDDWIGRARLLVELGNVPDVDLGRERTALLDHLHAALRDPTAPEVWAELTIVLRQLDAEELAGFEADISARAPNDLVHAYASRLAELGDHARRRRVLDHITTHDRRPQDVLSMQILLADASTLAELEPFLAEHPDYAGYAWVIDGIRRRGWAVAYARRALRETTRTRIAIWDALWKQLDDPLRAELRPALLQALADDVRGGIGTRHDFWDRLDLAERRDLWRLQWSADRPVPSRPHVSLPAAPSLALGLADEHARTVEEVVRWLVGG
jgi:hypothetical protein